MEYFLTRIDRPFVREQLTTAQALAYPIGLSILLWIVKSTLIIKAPLRSLAMTPWLIDDSFIIMRIARNLAAGKGYSFDGLEPTTGAPLLWTLLTSLNHFTLNLELAAKATMIESALFGAASTILVFYIAYRLFNQAIAWAAFILAALSEPLFFNAINGMETGLFTFLGLLAVLYYLELEKFGRNKGNYLFLGSLLGLVNLTRLDGVFLASSIILLEGFRFLKSDMKERRSYPVKIVFLLIGLFILTLPALLWSLYANGSLFPANQTGRRFLAWEGAILLDGTVVWAAYLEEVVSNIPKLTNLVSITVGSAFLAMLALISQLWQKRGVLFGQLVALYLGTYFGALVAYQGYFPDVHGLRYLNLMGHLLSILMAAFCFRIIFHSHRTIFLRYIIFIGIILSLLWSSAYQYDKLVDDLDWAKEMEIMPVYAENGQAEWWAFIDWVVDNLPQGTVIAAKDHGRLAYFTNTHIVDLAGIIDPLLIEQLQAGDIRPYLESKQVQYVILPDERGELIHEAIREAVNLENVPAAPPQEGTGYSLYRVLP